MEPLVDYEYDQYIADSWCEINGGGIVTKDQLNRMDILVDRSCVILDGNCDCERPVFENCKHLKRIDEEDKDKKQV